MYLEYYGLREAPFSITPDPRYVFLSDRHRDALAHLLYGVGKGGSGGFVQLTGEVGTGKTTLSRLLLEQLPENTQVALLLNPRLSPVEMIETVCEELKLDVSGKRGSLKALTDALNTYLLDAYAQGLRVVLIVDEADRLPPASRDALAYLLRPFSRVLIVVPSGAILQQFVQRLASCTRHRIYIEKAGRRAPPAARPARTPFTCAAMSAVSVLVIDCTTIG